MTTRRMSGLARHALAALLVAGCGDGDSVSPQSLDGTWNGSTSQGKPLSFTIADGAITSFTVGFRITGSLCTTEGSATGSSSLGLPIGNSVGDEFSISFLEFDSSTGRFGDIAFTVSGRLDSGTSMSGTVQITSQRCAGSVDATWSATKS